MDTTVLQTEFRRHDAPPSLHLLCCRVPHGDIRLIPGKAQMARLTEPVADVVSEAGFPLLSPGTVLVSVSFGRMVVQIPGSEAGYNLRSPDLDGRPQLGV